MSRETEQPLRAYYLGQRLDETALSRIHENALLAETGRDRPRPRPVRKPALVVGLVLALLLGAGGLAWRVAVPDATAHIDAEVRTNYAKDLEPEVRADNFAELAAGLPRLGFALAPSTEEGPLTGWQVTGGRYCSLAGELAAQINLSDARGRQSLLYIVPLVEALQAVEPGVRRHAATDVHIWRDAQRLYVQAIPK
ncbi:MAG: hypothetical protein ACFE0O_11450 [Opitutales bacterium]